MTTMQSENLDKTALNERRIIIRNTKRMEDNFIKKNIDLNKEEMTNCRDQYGKQTSFISSKTQEHVINRILAETTRSVSESDKYDSSDNSVARAKRIYSRKKENLKILSTVFNNGGHMVKYFKYATRSGDISSKAVTSQLVRNFIDRLRNAYRQAEVIYIDGERHLKMPENFTKSMVKLNIFEHEDQLCLDKYNKN